MVKRHAHSAPSRKGKAKRINLMGDYEGFWYVANAKASDQLFMQRIQGQAKRLQDDDFEKAADMTESVLRKLLDELIVDHNFVDMNDEPYPVGDGLFDALDGGLLDAIWQVSQSNAATDADPNAGSATSATGSATTEA